MRCVVLLGVMLIGCARVNEAPDAFTRDAGPPDPAASMNCRASLLLPRGTYWIGSDVPRPGGLVSHGPAFEATFTRDGWVTRFESTNACYLACVNGGGCSDTGLMWFRDETRTREPVYWLRFEQAASYCAWLGGRLLTDSEWEALARGPDGRLWPWFPPPTNPQRPEDGPLGEPASGDRAVGDWSLVGPGPGDDLVPSPVGSYPDARGFFGHEDVIANAPEWVLGGAVIGYPPGPHTDPIFEDPLVPHIGRAVPTEVGGGATARCLFTSPPEPLYVQE